MTVPQEDRRVIGALPSPGATETVEEAADEIMVLYASDHDADTRAEIEDMLAGLVADVVAYILENLALMYPADVFPPDSDSRDAIAGTALRTVLTAQARRWRAGRDG